MSKQKRKLKDGINPPAQVRPRVHADTTELSSSGKSGTTGAANFLCLLFIGISFCLAFFYLSRGSSARKDYPEKVPCKIIENNVSPVKLRPSLTVRYAYEFNGIWHTNRLYDENFKWFEDAYRKAAKFRVGEENHCLINALHPAHSVLINPGVSDYQFIASAWFLFGSIMLYAMRTLRKQSRSRRITVQFKMLASGLILLPVPLFILLASAQPVFDSARAYSWEIKPCTIVGSYEIISTGRRGKVSKRFVIYSYEMNGQQWFSNRYKFSSFLMVDHFPNPTGICYVNPNTPSQAAVTRNLHVSVWTILFPLFFFCAISMSWWNYWRPRLRLTRKLNRLVPTG